MQRLPQEIIDIIIDHVHDDIPGLKICSMVCKSWLDPARYHLFITKTFRNHADIESIQRWKSSPHLGLLVQNVVIGTGRQYTTGFHNIDITMLDPSLSSQPIPNQLLENIATPFRNLKSLNLTFVKFHKLIDAFTLIASFPSLRQLCCIEVLFEELSTASVHLVAPPLSISNLHITFHLGSDNGEIFLEWLSLYSSRISLQALTIESSGPISRLLSFLHLWKSSLSRLDMSGILSDFSQICGLESMTCLEEVCLPFVHLLPIPGCDPHDWVCDLLFSLTSPHLRIIKIPLEIYYDLSDVLDDLSHNEDYQDEALEHIVLKQLDRMDWERVDQRLVEIHDRSHLRKIDVLVKLVSCDLPIAKTVIRRLLPQTLSRGVTVETRMWDDN